MPDNDSSIIKPVESLQNISGLTPTRRREQRKKRQTLNQENGQNPEQETDEQLDDQCPKDKNAQNQNRPGTIDYCA
jgi:hypothetical protein